MTTIYIKNLSDQADTAKTRALFEAFGAVVSMHLTPGGAGHRSGGIGLVEMEDGAARRAIAGIDGTVFQGTLLSVREADAVEVSDTGPATLIPAQPAEPPPAPIRRRYELVEMEKVGGPGGAPGDDWYRYVLVRRASRIVCFRRGSLAEVTTYAETCAEAFDDRSLHCRSTFRIMIPRKR
jgi:hypothetical protein